MNHKQRDGLRGLDLRLVRLEKMDTAAVPHVRATAHNGRVFNAFPGGKVDEWFGDPNYPRGTVIPLDQLR